jgi:flagellar protein FliS
MTRTVNEDSRMSIVNTAHARARFVNDGLAVLSGPKLLLALYERLSRDLDDASSACRGASVAAVHAALVHAQEIVQELWLALDAAAWDGAAGLAELYDWLARELVSANIAKDLDAIDRCRQVVEPLRGAWTDAAVGAARAAR